MNHAEYNTGVQVIAFLASVGCVTQGLVYDNISFAQLSGMLLLISSRTLFKFVKNRNENALVLKILISLTVLAIIIGALFDSGLLSWIFGFLGIWPVQLFYKDELPN